MTASMAIEIGALGHLDLNAVLDGAARLRPGRPALSDGSDAPPLRFADFDRKVLGLASQLAQLKLAPQSRLLLLGGASISSILLIFAALRAGLDIALAPAFLDPAELRRFAQDVEAVGLAVDPAFLAVRSEDYVLEMAAGLPGVRVICAMSPMDSAVLLDPDIPMGSENVPDNKTEALVILHDPQGPPAYYNQRRLLAAALDVATQARIGTQQPILSTLSPMSFAGFVAGPLAALLAGTQLVLHAPFERAAFAAALGKLEPCHLLAPAALLPALARERVTASRHCASLVLSGTGEAPPQPGAVEESLPAFNFSWSGSAGYSFTRRGAEPQPLAVMGQRMRAATIFNQA
ncbi:MAG: AMP-dependent synthetase [Hyphomicrobiales bacterium]|nr:AMP-dependent synthetase [Hyphomicrobiales bacterium]